MISDRIKPEILPSEKLEMFIIYHSDSDLQLLRHIAWLEEEVKRLMALVLEISRDQDDSKVA